MSGSLVIVPPPRTSFRLSSASVSVKSAGDQQLVRIVQGASLLWQGSIGDRWETLKFNLVSLEPIQISGSELWEFEIHYGGSLVKVQSSIAVGSLGSGTCVGRSLY